MKISIKLRIIPPGERVCSKPLEKPKKGEKGGHSDNEIDKLLKLGPGSNGMDNQVKYNHIVDEKDRGPEAGAGVHGKKRGEKGEYEQDRYRYIEWGPSPLPFPPEGIVQQKGGHGYEGDQMDNAHSPAMDRSPGKRSEDEQGVEGVAGKAKMAQG
jgi:hypothetical protein